MQANSKKLITSILISFGSAALGYLLGYNSNLAKKSEDAEPDLEVIDQSGEEQCKMVLVVRKDLPMTKGKIAAQCAHAALACYEKAVQKTPKNVQVWKSQGQAKIALQCEGYKELQRLKVRAARIGLIAEEIVDAGRTQIEPGSTTVLGIGPGPVSLVNEVTGDLKLL